MKIIPEVQVIYIALIVGLVFPCLKLDISIYLVIFQVLYYVKMRVVQFLFILSDSNL